MSKRLRPDTWPSDTDVCHDLASLRARDEIAAAIVSSRGKPVSEWGDALSALGHGSSHEVRAAVLALNRLTDASVVSLSISANAASASKAAEAGGPKTAAEIVGPVLTPAFVN